MFQGNSQTHEDSCRVRFTHQLWCVRRALRETFFEQSLMSPWRSQNHEKTVERASEGAISERSAHPTSVLKSSSRVAQAFQPVLIVEAGTEARPTKIFHNLRVGRSPMRNCYEKFNHPYFPPTIPGTVGRASSPHRLKTCATKPFHGFERAKGSCAAAVNFEP